MATRRRRRFSALLLPLLVPLAFSGAAGSSSPSLRHEQPRGGSPPRSTVAVAEESDGRTLGHVTEEGLPSVAESWDSSQANVLRQGKKEDEHSDNNNSTPGDLHLSHPPSTRGPEEAFEATTAASRPTAPPLPPLLHALLRVTDTISTTTVSTTSSQEASATTPVAATTAAPPHPSPPQRRRLPPGAITLPPKPWLPPTQSPRSPAGQQHRGGGGGKHRNFGPYFEEGAEGSNVTARLGSTVLLDCKIGMLRDKTVTWLHRKEDIIHLLTVGRQTYSSDSRFSLAYRYPNNWRLRISVVSRSDEGLYECQVATHPPRIRQIFLRVTAPELKIVDEDHHEVLERYYKAGSEVELTCVATQLERGDGEAEETGREAASRAGVSATPGTERAADGRVVWRHAALPITRNTSDRGIWLTASADGQNVSVTLTLKSAKKSDGGNYTCAVGGLASVTVSIHILNGELPAAVQYGNATVPLGPVSTILLLCCLAVSMVTRTR